MYRELTAVALERGTAADDGPALAALVGDRPAAGTDIRAERISRVVSTVSRHPEVREQMRERQRELAGSAAVLEGRDTGTRVCPEADLKVYLTAPVAVRAAPARPAARAAGRGGGAGDRGARPAGCAADAARARRTPDRYRRHGCRRSRGDRAGAGPGADGVTAAERRTWRLLRIFLKAPVLLLLRPVVRGREHVPRSGPLLLVSNHESFWDIPLLGRGAAPRPPVHGQGRAASASRSSARSCAPAARSRCVAARPTGKRFGPSTTRSAAGDVVAIFLQGHRQAELDGAKAGAGRCAVVEEVPVVPVAIRGTGGWRPGRRPRLLRGAAQLRARRAAAGRGLPGNRRRADGRDPAN